MLNSNHIYLIRLAIYLEESWKKQNFKKKEKKKASFLEMLKKGKKKNFGGRAGQEKGGTGL